MKLPIRLWWLLAIVVTTSLGSQEFVNPKQDGKYLIYFSDVAYMGEDFEIMASVFNATTTTHLTIELQESPNKTVVAALEDDISSETTKLLKMPVPILLKYNYRLVVNGSGGVNFSESTYIYFSRGRSAKKHHDIIIQLDKPLYKPLDHVKFRVFGIHPDLRASKSPLNVTITDPKKNIMQRWFNEQPPSGVSSFDYELSDKPVMGKWSIEMQQEGKKEFHYFEVKEYVLPNYKVTIQGVKNIPSLGYGYLFLFDKVIHVNVTAKYTFGKSVRGYLFLNASIDGTSDGLSLTFERPFTGETSIQFTLRDFMHTGPVKVLRYHSCCNPRKITFTATVREELTGKMMQAESFTTEIVNAPVKIEIQKPIIIKRGLPEKVKIEIRRVDGNPLEEPDLKFPLEVITNHGNNLVHKEEHNISADGNVVLDLLIPVTRRGSFTIKAIYRGEYEEVKYEISEMAYPNEFINEHEDSIEATLIQERVNIGDDIKILINSTTPISLAIITQLTNNKIISNRNETVGEKTNFMIEIPTSEMMIPSTSIVISCITASKRLMVDASTVKITIGFKNDVVGAFTKNEGKPGTNVDFKVKTLPGSAVFVMAVDKNLHLLQNAKYITEDMIYGALIGHESLNIWRRSAYSIHDILRSLRLSVMTNFIEKRYHRIHYNRVAHGESDLLSSHYPVYMAPPGPPQTTSAPPPRIRKFFPETWIWHDGEVGESGEYTLSKTVPDSITMWQANAFAFHPDDGLGIMKQPVEFLSHQDFFIHPELPYSLIRGESFILKVSIFSNLTLDQEVTVSLPESSEFHVNNSANSVTVTVKAHSDNTARFHVIPTAVGNIPIKIRATCELAADEIHKEILVKPEGYTLHYNEPFLLKVTEETPVEIDYELNIKPDAVKDSERVEVSVIGDIMGPSIEGLGNLIRIPSGCGEQNMINFAPNIYIHNYLKATSKLTPEQFKLIKMYTEKGYKNQLQYQRSDGSFSAFGSRDTKGSTWLTAFVLRCFSQAQKSIPELFIDDQIIHKGVYFLLRKQTKENLFKEDGRVLHGAMQGGASKGVALTAYVLISLFEVKDRSNLTQLIFDEVAEDLPINGTNTYTLGMMLYLMSLIENSSKFNTIEAILDKQAINSDGMKYWKTEDTNKVATYRQSASTGIELASYILLAYTHQGMIEKGIPIMKWLMSQRNSLGGFHSTQDTVLGLEALSSFAAKVKSPKSLTVTVTADNTTSHTFPEIGPLTNTVLNKHVLPSDTKKIHINAVGTTFEGTLYTYALAQISWQYNIKLGSVDSVFVANVEYKAITSNEIEIEICPRLKELNLTGMVIVEAALPSGFALTNKQQLLNLENVSKVELEDAKVILYLKKLSITFSCYTLKASKVFDIQGHLSPLPVKIRLYYEPDLELVIMYQITGGSE